MAIQLTNEQWADVQAGTERPVLVHAPVQGSTYVLLRSEVYERFKSLFEEDPITPQERAFQLREFGRRAGWDDPAMDVYDDLDPRQKS